MKIADCIFFFIVGGLLATILTLALQTKKVEYKYYSPLFQKIVHACAKDGGIFAAKPFGHGYWVVMCNDYYVVGVSAGGVVT